MMLGASKTSSRLYGVTILVAVLLGALNILFLALFRPQKHPVRIERALDDSKNRIASAKGRNWFSRKYCNLTGVDEWYATDWHARAPFLVIAGAKKSASTSLYWYLEDHPMIVPGRWKEMHIFGRRFFQYWKNQGTAVYDSNGRVLVQQLREDIYNTAYQTWKDKPAEYNFPNSSLLQRNQSLISLDATPDVMMYPPSAIRRVLCTCPWIKVLMILREPVDRTFSHFNFLKALHWGPKFMASFETFLENDLERMHLAGLLEENVTNQPKAETEAWERYWFDEKVVESQVARGLYAVQLKNWREAMKEIGRNPETEILVLRTEQLQSDPNRTLNTVYRWLGLPEWPLLKRKLEMPSEYGNRTMDPETRQRLELLYKPYTERLYGMLGKEWGRWGEKRE